MFHFSKWTEIYFGSDMTEYFRIQNRLRNEGVKFKTKEENTRDRMSMDTITGGNPLALNNVGLADNYTILVRQEDEYKARELIGMRN